MFLFFQESSQTLFEDKVFWNTYAFLASASVSLLSCNMNRFFSFCFQEKRNVPNQDRSGLTLSETHLSHRRSKGDSRQLSSGEGGEKREKIDLSSAVNKWLVRKEEEVEAETMAGGKEKGVRRDGEERGWNKEMVSWDDAGHFRLFSPSAFLVSVTNWHAMWPQKPHIRHDWILWLACNLFFIQLYCLGYLFEERAFI